MAITLEGARSYTISIDGFGRVTYREGETVAPQHFEHVPDGDHDLFKGQPKPANTEKANAEKKSSKKKASGKKSSKKTSSAKDS